IQFHSIEELFASFDKDPPPPPVSTHGIAFPPDYTPEKYRLIFSKSVSRPTPTYTSSDPEINS
ncbi:MAG: hypothetical protein JSS09_05455, partial [Verrucomicrobia bacterium]|nr:hypothetical protein [Verrucomicrobiota bacterium]